MANAHQQFSLKWNNYSQHIVTALEELRVDDELTDVTLTSEGQRIKAHKVLLSACSVFFKETFKENPCKHPVVILKGVSFQELQAVVQFMYNGQVNVSQERLPSFLQTAEILQIKGLTDSASDKEETVSPIAPVKKRPQTFPPQASVQQIDSIRHDAERPPTPKRKRIIGSSANTGTFISSAQTSELPGTASVISASGSGTTNNANPNNGHLHPNNLSNLPPALQANNSDNSGDGMSSVKYEDHEDIEEDYDRNEDSFQDNNDKDAIDGESDLSNLGSGKFRTAANGAGERRPRYGFQPSTNDLLSTTEVVDATNVNLHQNGMSRDMYDAKQRASLGHVNGIIASNGSGHLNSSSKLRNRLCSRSLSSGLGGYLPQQDDRVIKYAPLQSHNGGYTQDTRNNISGKEERAQNGHAFEEGSESAQGTDEEEEHYPYRKFQQPQARRASISQAMNLQKSRAIPSLIKGNPNSISQPQTQQQILPRTSEINVVTKGITNNANRNVSNSNGVEDLSVSSPAHDLTTPSFSLTQQLLQQNVLSLISHSSGAEVIKTNGSGGSRVNTIAAKPSTSSISTPVALATNGSGSGGSSSNAAGNGTGAAEQCPLIAPYVCDVCGKRYVHHRSLNDHKKSHTGATRCPVCNKSFSKVANMRAHYAAQHGSGSNNSSSPNTDCGSSSNGNHNGDSGNNLNDDNQFIDRLLKSSA